MLVMCNGMIRAGSTLQYNLVRSLAEETDHGIGEGFFEPAEFLKLREQLHMWAEDNQFHIIKSHNLHPDVHEIVTTGSLKICYIYRDIRDVAVSAKRKWKLRGNALIARLDDAVTVFYQIQGIPEGVLTQKYERVIEDPHGAVKALASFLNIDVEDDLISTVVQSCSLDNAEKAARQVRQCSPLFVVSSRLGLKLRHLLTYLGISRSVYDGRTLLHADHISEHRGQVGIWRDALTKHEQALITQRYAKWLVSQEYADSIELARSLDTAQHPDSSRPE